MFQKILVPLDGSALAEQALEPALRLAESAHGELLLLSIPYLKYMFVSEPAGYGLLWPNQSRAHTHHELDAYLQSLQSQYAATGFTWTSHISQGDEASVIVDTAVSQNVDLIVMSTHGRSGFSHWYLGSVTEKVLQSAPCPVLVIREARPLRHTLITLDGSKLSERALVPGLALANCFNTAVTLLRVEEPDEIDPATLHELDEYDPALAAQAHDAFCCRTETYLTDIVQRYQPLCRQPLRPMAMSGSPAKEILGTIENTDVDLVVMATHGRTGLRRWVFGSVTEKVMRRGPGAMLLVRPPSAALKSS